MLNPTLNELNKFVNNKNSEKRRVNHLFSDVNGKEFTDVKIIPAEVRPITTSITDFSSMSDWCSAESELLRKKVVEYESPVSKNTSLAMSSIIPLPEQDVEADAFRSVGYEQRKREIEKNDIHLQDDYKSASPKKVKQLHMKSNLHPEAFYKENPGTKSVEDKEVYEFQVAKLPSKMESKELARVVKGVHVVKAEVDYDRIKGDSKGKGTLIIRSSPGKIEVAKKALEEKGLKVSKTIQRETGKKSNFPKLSTVTWKHPRLQAQEHRLTSRNLKTADCMKVQNLYESKSEVFGGDGKYQEKWKSKLDESRIIMSETKAQKQGKVYSSSKMRESLNSWSKVKGHPLSSQPISSKSSTVSLLSCRSKR